jgi:hypothetical protein
MLMKLKYLKMSINLTLPSLTHFGLFTGESSFETTVPLHPVQGSPLESPRPGFKVIRVLT